MSGTAWIALPILTLSGAACRGGPPAPPATLTQDAPPKPPTPPASAARDPDVAATVDKVLTSAQHPGLAWSAIPDVVPALNAVYAAEADKLVWFDGTTADAMTEPTLAAVSAAGDHGLDAKDYDAAPLADQWKAIAAGKASGPERALFDVAKPWP